MGFIKKHPTIAWGIGITFLFLLLSFARLGFIDILDYKFYDAMMRLRGDAESQADIVLVEIDDDSIEKLGRWPWPRSLVAEGILKINAGGPKLIGLNLILAEPSKNPALRILEELEGLFAAEVLRDSGPKGRMFLEVISESRAALDEDRILTEALMQAGNVVLPVYFKESAVAADATDIQDAALIAQSIQNIRDPLGFGAACYHANDITLPVPAFFKACRGVGHINIGYDGDGTLRRERLLYNYGGLFFPSYTLKLASLYLNLNSSSIRADLGEAVHLGSLEIPTTVRSEQLVSFKGPGGAFKRYSFFDVVNEKVPASLFKNKLVIIGPSAAGLMNPLPTPVDNQMALGEFSANAVWAVLNQQFIEQPAWAGMAEFLLILLIGAVVTVLLPRFKAKIAGGIFIALMGVLIGGAAYFFAVQGLWTRTAYPVLLLLFGYVGVVSINYFLTETSKEKVEGESAESNRQLGLTYQAQGMLDMAYDKFLRVPMDDQLKGALYNLGLDFERKRQLNKAASVYEYIEEHDSKYKDVRDRKKKLMQASDTMMFGDGFLGTSGSGDTLMTSGTGTRPTLGRYEIMRQLGKGAMGIVYLGQDPRINRTTAIKTFRFTDEFEPDEVEKMKEKFFREAESAGTLSHPNIVTIYDAGDEQDLAYIAMEFLEGEDLEKYTKKENLLTIRKTVKYAADLADALDYAHERGIVHRDIKPANVMLLKSGVIKVTDFGIARITASSHTQTGVVKGTPYYMSPEQISGEKVDGRSDQFSLAVMIYQLLTGELPFRGDNPAALMNRIMNVAHPDPRKFNPKIPKPLVTILDRALQKDKEKRYPKLKMMAAHLQQLGRKMDAAAAQKPANSTAV